MINRRHCWPVLILLFPLFALAQSDGPAGTWEMKYLPAGSTDSVCFQLKVGRGEKNVLFPAMFTLQFRNYTGSFEFLLVKKNSRELAISKNKTPLDEQPFSLGQATFGLNGVFDQTKNGRGEFLMELRRIQTHLGDWQNKDSSASKADAVSLRGLQTFLSSANILLKKLDHLPWENRADTSGMPVYNNNNPYFGVLDSAAVTARDAIITYLGTKKPKNDLVSVSLNGQVINEQVAIGKRNTSDEILLDTGLNILVFFADNFGNQLPSKGKLQLSSGGKGKMFDFEIPRDSAASFIAARLYVGTDKTKEKYFPYYHYGASIPLLKDEKLLGSLVTNTATLTLGIIDDAVEDGDSISIKLNEKWVTVGFPVKKYAQFIKLQLQPGPNTLVFKADNLGSIPPNTSIIELIDGNRRKAFSMETSLGEKNLIRVLYDTSQ